MVDACLAQRLHLYTALAEISGTAHVQQIDVANYIITLARHRLNRTYTDPDTAYHDLRQPLFPSPPQPAYTCVPDPQTQQHYPRTTPQTHPPAQHPQTHPRNQPAPHPAAQSSSGQSRPGKRKQPAPELDFTACRLAAL
ncbi:hypothetical protein [Streptomyces sp. NBC_01614]